MSEHEPPDRAELLPDTVEDKPLFLIVKKWLELEGLSFDLLDPMTDIAEPQTTLRLPIQGRIGKWICILRILEKTERIVVYSVLPDKAEDDHQRHRLYELLSWFNYGLILGNFEIDPRDGEVRYKTSMDVEGVTVGPRPGGDNGPLHDPSRPSLHGGGPVPQRRQHPRGHGHDVLRHVELRQTQLWEVGLVGAGEPDVATVDVEGDRIIAGHGASLRA